MLAAQRVVGSKDGGKIFPDSSENARRLASQLGGRKLGKLFSIKVGAPLAFSTAHKKGFCKHVVLWECDRVRKSMGKFDGWLETGSNIMSFQMENCLYK